jgi:hypothetical protein
MLARYREFRRFGHGRIVSAMHAPTHWQLLLAVCCGGLALGIWL